MKGVEMKREIREERGLTGRVERIKEEWSR